MTALAHALAEIDDDGTVTVFFRRYRYVCRCGRTGIWRDGIVLARADHAVHKNDARKEQL